MSLKSLAYSLPYLLCCTRGCAPEHRATEPGVLVVTESEQTASFIRNFNPLLEPRARVRESA